MALVRLLLALLLGGAMLVGPGAAQTGAVVHIRDHPGGFLPRIVAETEAIRRSGAEVRIDGGYCFSACTVFLSLERACVAPHTRFGFHAPADPRTGAPLSGPAFEQATRHVARYYRPALAAWWLREGRHIRSGLAMRSGAELIAMGYRRCSEA